MGEEDGDPKWYKARQALPEPERKRLGDKLRSQSLSYSVFVIPMFVLSIVYLKHIFISPVSYLEDPRTKEYVIFAFIAYVGVFMTLTLRCPHCKKMNKAGLVRGPDLCTRCGLTFKG